MVKFSTRKTRDATEGNRLVSAKDVRLKMCRITRQQHPRVLPSLGSPETVTFFVDKGTDSIVVAEPEFIYEVAARAAKWVEATSDGDQPTRPPRSLPKDLMARKQWEHIPPICGIANVPVPLDDGTIISEPGYNKDTGLLIDLRGEFPAIPDRPTIDDAINASKVLAEVYEDFQFAGHGVYRSGAIALPLTLVGRHAFSGKVPLFGVDANVAAAGKDLLINAGSNIETGHDAPSADFPEDGAELRKVVTSTLMSGEQLFHLDRGAEMCGGRAVDGRQHCNCC
jgi:hypothetical protein